MINFYDYVCFCLRFPVLTVANRRLNSYEDHHAIVINDDEEEENQLNNTCFTFNTSLCCLFNRKIFPFQQPSIRADTETTSEITV